MSEKKNQEQVNKYMLKGTLVGLVIAIIYDICMGCLLWYFVYLCNLKVWDETGMANVS